MAGQIHLAVLRATTALKRYARRHLARARSDAGHLPASPRRVIALLANKMRAHGEEMRDRPLSLTAPSSRALPLARSSRRIIFGHHHPSIRNCSLACGDVATPAMSIKADNAW